MKPNLILVANWITALRSGQYLQGQRGLKFTSPEGQIRHCCLGVACEIVQIPSQLQKDGMTYNFNGWTCYPPQEVNDLFGFKLEQLELSLDGKICEPAVANDGWDKSFSEIADAIERHFNLSPYKS